MIYRERPSWESVTYDRNKNCFNQTPDWLNDAISKGLIYKLGNKMVFKNLRHDDLIRDNDKIVRTYSGLILASDEYFWKTYPQIDPCDGIAPRVEAIQYMGNFLWSDEPSWVKELLDDYIWIEDNEVYFIDDEEWYVAPGSYIVKYKGDYQLYLEEDFDNRFMPCYTERKNSKKLSNSKMEDLMKCLNG